MKRTIFVITSIVCLCGSSRAGDIKVYFDDANNPQIIEGYVQQRTVSWIQPQVFGKADNITGMPIANLLVQCTTAERINFYKSLFFANGGLASANLGGISKCLSKDGRNKLESLLKKSADPNDVEHKMYDCTCNSSNQLRCKKSKDDVICDTSTCWGPCDLFSKQTLEYPVMNELFSGVPEKVAEEFVGGFVFRDGKVILAPVTTEAGKYYGEKIVKILEIVMGI